MSFANQGPAHHGPVHVVHCRDAIPGVWSGGYVLRIRLGAPLGLVFGRYRGGVELQLTAGEYAYVGSAAGSAGAPLAYRLVRHATRTEPRPAHAIRDAVSEALGRCLGRAPSGSGYESTKKLHWHIDYLLDRPEAELVAIVAVVSARRVESELYRLLGKEPALAPVAPGLGASDHVGRSHLFVSSRSWWERFLARVDAEFQ